MGGVQRKSFRILLGITLAITSVFAAWAWLRPYEWGADPGARLRVTGAQVIRDHSFYWLDVHLRLNSGEGHDLEKPVRLLTAGGRELEPADTTLSGSAEMPVSELWLRFWLEEQDLEGNLDLRLNDGKLAIRRGNGLPRLGNSGRRYFTSSRW